MKVTAVIMAGGRGERFWPKSRGNYPKQFLSLTKDGETMIQKTVKRLLPMVAMDDVFVVTNVSYAALVKEQLPQLPEDLNLLHTTQIGRVYTLIVRGNPADIRARMAQYNPILMEALPLSLEEIFIYEMGGEDYGVRDIVL